VPFSLHDGKIGFITAGASAFWPLTGIASILSYCKHVSTAATIETKIPALPPIWHAASLGLQNEGHLGALVEAGLRPFTIRCNEDHLTALFKLVMLNKEEFWHLPPSEYSSEDRHFPFRLTMANLSTYQTVDAGLLAMGRLIVVVGDSLADFCLHYDLSRLRHGCLWLPWAWLESSHAGLRRIETEGGRLSIEECLAGVFARTLVDATLTQSVVDIRFCSTSLSSQQLDLAIPSLQAADGVSPSYLRGTSHPIGPEILDIDFPLQIFNSGNVSRPAAIPIESGFSLSPVETPKPTAFRPSIRVSTAG
jgi:hypothetical protein